MTYAVFEGGDTSGSFNLDAGGWEIVYGGGISFLTDYIGYSSAVSEPYIYLDTTNITANSFGWAGYVGNDELSRTIESLNNITTIYSDPVFGVAAAAIATTPIGTYDTTAVSTATGGYSYFADTNGYQSSITYNNVVYDTNTEFDPGGDYRVVFPRVTVERPQTTGTVVNNYDEYGALIDQFQAELSSNVIAGTISELRADVVALTEEYQSGRSDIRLVGPGLTRVGSAGAVKDFGTAEDISFFQTIQNRAADSVAGSGLAPGFVDPIEFGAIQLNDGSFVFASNEDAEAYGSAYLQRVLDVLGVSEQAQTALTDASDILFAFIRQNPDLFLVRQAESVSGEPDYFELRNDLFDEAAVALSQPNVVDAIRAQLSTGVAPGDLNLNLASLQISPDNIIEYSEPADDSGVSLSQIDLGRNNDVNPGPGYPSNDAFGGLTNAESDQVDKLLDDLYTRLPTFETASRAAILETISISVEAARVLDQYGDRLAEAQRQDLQDLVDKGRAIADKSQGLENFLTSAVDSLSDISIGNDAFPENEMRRLVSGDALELLSLLSPEQQRIAEALYPGLLTSLRNFAFYQPGGNPFVSGSDFRVVPFDLDRPGPITDTRAAIDAAVANYIAVNGSIDEATYNRIERAILDARTINQQNLLSDDTYYGPGGIKEGFNRILTGAEPVPGVGQAAPITPTIGADGGGGGGGDIEIDPDLVPGFTQTSTGLFVSAEDLATQQDTTVGARYASVYNPETGTYDVVNLANNDIVESGLDAEEAAAAAEELSAGDPAYPEELGVGGIPIDEVSLNAEDVADDPFVQTEGGLFVLPEDLDPTNTSEESFLLGQTQNARIQEAINTQNGQIQEGDWRVRLRLAEGADYLYRADQPGILLPLVDTDGVIFPYTPQISTTYGANYNQYDLTHSNFRGYFYQNSYVDAINIQATFTAQDTTEADYLLAVIHFFRSVTKMFYGQDANRGVPPPMVFLTGLGQYQFNDHPCLVRTFNYTLPQDVDYIRARTANIDGSNLLKRRTRQSATQNPLSVIMQRLFNNGLTSGALEATPDAPTLGTAFPTYVPTKMEIQIELLPVQSRRQVSQVFSLEKFATGQALRGGFW